MLYFGIPQVILNVLCLLLFSLQFVNLHLQSLLELLYNLGLFINLLLLCFNFTSCFTLLPLGCLEVAFDLFVLTALHLGVLSLAHDVGFLGGQLFGLKLLQVLLLFFKLLFQFVVIPRKLLLGSLVLLADLAPGLEGLILIVGQLGQLDVVVLQLVNQSILLLYLLLKVLEPLRVLVDRVIGTDYIVHHRPQSDTFVLVNLDLSLKFVHFCEFDVPLEILGLLFFLQKLDLEFFDLLL